MATIKVLGKGGIEVAVKFPKSRGYGDIDTAIQIWEKKGNSLVYKHSETGYYHVEPWTPYLDQFNSRGLIRIIGLN